MHDYRLDDPRRGIIGPVRLDTVRDLVEAAVIGKDVLVSRDGGPWQPIHTFAELFAAMPTETRRQPTYSGDLGKNTFFKVFYRFHFIRATGVLAFKRDGEQKDIYLEAGRPVFVASTVESERIGQFLLQRGKLTDQQLEEALRIMHQDKNHLGYTLIRLGFIGPQDFYAHLQDQQKMRLVELCRWENGRYQFFEGELYKGAKTNLNLVAPEILLAATRKMSAETLARRLEDHLEDIPRRVPQQDVDKATFRLATLEQRALNLIDGNKSVLDLLRLFANDDERRAAVLRVIYLLLEIDGLVFTRT